MGLNIRQETDRDNREVCFVVKTAFATAEHCDGTEQDLVEALRRGSAFVPELSLVAEEGEKIIGHILFTKASVGSQTVLALAPLSVLPEYQRKGVGSALVTEGHRIARTLGFFYSVVLGSETYYPRFGYVPSVRLGILPPFEVPAENFMALRLREDAPPVSGVLNYPKEFGIERLENDEFLG